MELDPLTNALTGLRWGLRHYRGLTAPIPVGGTAVRLTPVEPTPVEGTGVERTPVEPTPVKNTVLAGFWRATDRDERMIIGCTLLAAADAMSSKGIGGANFLRMLANELEKIDV